MVDEGLVDRGLQGLQAVDILGLLRQERVGKAFRPARRDHAPLDPLPGHQFGKAEAGEDHADRADDASCRSTQISSAAQASQ